MQITMQAFGARLMIARVERPGPRPSPRRARADARPGRGAEWLRREEALLRMRSLLRESFLRGGKML